MTVNHCLAPNFHQYLTGRREMFYLQFFINSFVVAFEMIPKTVKRQNYSGQIVIKRAHATFKTLKALRPGAFLARKMHLDHASRSS